MADPNQNTPALPSGFTPVQESSTPALPQGFTPVQDEKKKNVDNQTSSSTNSTQSSTTPVSQPTTGSGPDGAGDFLKEANANINKPVDDNLDETGHPKPINTQQYKANETALYDKINKQHIAESSAVKNYNIVEQNNNDGNIKQLHNLYDQLQGNLGPTDASGKQDTGAIQKQIDELRNKPVTHEGLMADGQDARKIILKSPYKTYGEMYDATQKAHKDFTESQSIAQTLKAETDPAIQAKRKDAGYVPDGKDAQGNEYLKLNPIQSFAKGAGDAVNNITIGMMKLNPLIDRATVQDELKHQYIKNNILYPEQPEGIISKVSEVAGGVAPLIAATAIAPEGVGTAIMNAAVFGTGDLGSGMKEGFNEGKSQGMSDIDAYDYAHKFSVEKGITGTILGGTMGLQSKLGSRLLLNEGEESAIKKFAGEQGVLVPTFMSKTLADNLYEKSQGGQKGTFDNVAESGASAFLIGLAGHAIANIPNLPDATRNVFENVMAKNYDRIGMVVDKMSDSGVISPETATNIKNKASAYASLPKDMTPAQEEVAVPIAMKIQANNEVIADNAVVTPTKEKAEIENEGLNRDLHETLGTPLSLDEQQSLGELKLRDKEKGDDGKLKKPLSDVERDLMEHLQARQDYKAPKEPKIVEPTDVGKEAPTKIGKVSIDGHGEDEMTADGKENGTEKANELTDKGKAEAIAQGEQVAKDNPELQVVFHGTTDRTTETAKIVAEKASEVLGKPVKTELQPLLDTWDIGKSEGKVDGSFDEEGWINKPDESPEGGESFNSFAERAKKAYEFLKDHPDNDHAISSSKMERMLTSLDESGGDLDKAKETYLTKLKEENADTKTVDNKGEGGDKGGEKEKGKNKLAESDIKPKSKSETTLDNGHIITTEPITMSDGEDGFKVTIEKPDGTKVDLGKMYPEDIVGEVNKKLRGYDLAATEKPQKEISEETPTEKEAIGKEVTFEHAGTEDLRGKVVSIDKDGNYKIKGDDGINYTKKPSDVSIQTPVTQNVAFAPPFSKEFIEHDIQPLVKSIGGNLKAGYDYIAKRLSPVTGVSEKAQNLIGKALGDRNLAEAKIDGALGQMQKMFDKMDDAARVKFVDNIKTGKQQSTPELQQIADLIKTLDKQLYDEIAKYKPSLNWKEDHFRVLWENPNTGKTGIFSKRPLQGTKGFMNQATLKDMSEGINRGLTPVTTNPIKMFKLAYNDGMKYITAQKMWAAMKDEGLAVFVKNGKDAPNNFVKLDDRLAKVYFPAEKGLVSTGEYYVDEGAGRLLNNYLSVNSGLLGSPIAKGAMEIKNLYTQAELSLSAFHAVAESLEASGSQLALGMRKMINLKDFSGGLKDILTSPAAPKTLFSLGRSAQKLVTDENFKNTELGQGLLKKMPDAEQYVKDFFDGGGKLKMSEDYRVKSLDAMKDAANKDNYIGAAIRALPALNDLVLNPLFNHYIPALKVGMFMKEFPVALAENKGRIDRGQITRQQIARNVNNFIDDRLGEMNFDNLFWDKNMKTAAQLMFRSVTWKLGNLRAMGGAIPEQAMEFMNAHRENRAPILMPKAAWVFGLSAMTTVIAAAIQGIGAGKKLESLKDVIAPQIDPNDPNQRAVVPTYLKDAMHFAHDPSGYLGTSTAGDISKMLDIWNNKDFYGYEIRDKTDPVLEQVKEMAEYYVPKPFAFASAYQQYKEKQSPARIGMSFMGFQKAPGYLIHSSIENKIFDLYNIRNAGTKPYKEKEGNDAKKEIKGLLTSGDKEAAEKKAKEYIDKGILQPKQMRILLKDVKGNASDYFFKKLPIEDKIDLLKEMSEEEKKRFDPHGAVQQRLKMKEKGTKLVKDEEESNSTTTP